MSIPQTYLIDISSGEHVAAAVFITHLLSCVSPFLFIFFDATFRWLAARNPTNRGERQLILDRQSCQARETARLLQQAS
jgi:hypothetical protein